eukprot:scaffold179420_cov41-Cyclotella_meneghiniana.AAC.1
MSSVTHNATAQQANNNRSTKKGLWNKLRRNNATALSKSADASQMAQAARQFHHNLSRSQTAGPALNVDNNNYGRNNASSGGSNLDVDELKRQHLERARYN